MEVDTDDDLLESSSVREARLKGKPPDILNNNLISEKQSNNNNLFSKNSSSSNKQKSSPRPKSGEYRPLLQNIDNMSDDQDHIESSSDFVHLSCNHFDNDPEFNDIVKKVEYAIDHNVLPQRIYEGSSGSYFCKNNENVLKKKLFKNTHIHIYIYIKLPIKA